MMDMPCWTVTELVTRYELEPTLNDVFVEGQSDKDIIGCAYDHSSKEKRKIYTADVVSIDDEIFEKNRLTKGNKQKLIILCRELREVNVSENVRFIVDRDTDHWFGELEEGKGLLWTEFCDIEAYFFEEPFVKELVVNAGRSKIGCWSKYYESFKLILKYLFSIRVSARELEIDLSYINFNKFLKVNANKVDFDLETYITRTLHKSKESKKLDDFKVCVEKWFNKLDGDPRLFCRGHDFIILLAWSILKFKGSKALSDEAVARILILLVPRDAERFSDLL